MYNVLEQAEAIFQGMALDVPAGSKLYGVLPGDTVRVKAIIQYRGPALSDNFYVAIGDYLVMFNELWVKSVPVSFAQSADWVTYELTADVLITKTALLVWVPGWFDLYAKIGTGLLPRAITPRLDNMIEIILAAEFQNFAIASYEKV